MEDILRRAANPWRMPKLEKIFQQLGVLASQQRAQGDDTTISDDAPLSDDKRSAIVREEELVRKALGLFGIDYDGLIAMDGKSAYSQAVATQPGLAKRVVEAGQPVLAALQVAVDYKPYAEFAAKYGTTPDDIKKNLQAEMAQEKKPQPAQPAPRQNIGPVFSAYASGGRSVPAGRKKDDLASLFGR